MKKIVALICALIMVSSIAVTALAACPNHYFVRVYQTAHNYTRPYYTTCIYKSSLHPHIRHYTDLITLYACPNCSETYTVSKTISITETCPCVH